MPQKPLFTEMLFEEPPGKTFAIVCELLFAKLLEKTSVVSRTCLAKTKKHRFNVLQPGTKSVHRPPDIPLVNRWSTVGFVFLSVKLNILCFRASGVTPKG